jgi:hypothetical protein
VCKVISRVIPEEYPVIGSTIIPVDVSPGFIVRGVKVVIIVPAPDVTLAGLPLYSVAVSSIVAAAEPVFLRFRLIV